MISATHVISEYIRAKVYGGRGDRGRDVAPLVIYIDICTHVYGADASAAPGRG